MDESSAEYPVETAAINGGSTSNARATFANPIITVDVDDIDSALTDRRSLGGSVVPAKAAIPGMGYFGYFRDTEGNVLGSGRRRPTPPQEAGPSAGSRGIPAPAFRPARLGVQAAARAHTVEGPGHGEEAHGFGCSQGALLAAVAITGAAVVGGRPRRLHRRPTSRSCRSRSR